MSTWTCDGCGKGWTHFPGVDSAANVTAEGKPAPLVACSEACSNVALARVAKRCTCQNGPCDGECGYDPAVWDAWEARQQ